MIEIDKKFNVLPESFLKKAISLTKIGGAELAWKYEDVFEVINWLMLHKYVILGGDVYKLEGDNIVTSYNDWYISNRKDDDWEDFITKGVKATEKYINNFHRKFGDNYCYVLVFTSEKKFNL